MSDFDIEPGSAEDPRKNIFSLGATMRSWRSALGMSQEALEYASGVSQKTISDIEKGEVENPQDGTLQKLARAFAEAANGNQAALFRDLKSARDNKAAPTSSAFAQRLGGMLQAHKPAERLFLEQSLIDHYFSQVKALNLANELAAELAKKKHRKQS